MGIWHSYDPTEQHDGQSDHSPAASGPSPVGARPFQLLGVIAPVAIILAFMITVVAIMTLRPSSPAAGPPVVSQPLPPAGSESLDQDWVALAEAQWSQRRYREAIDTLRHVGNADTRDDALRRLAAAAAEQHSYDEAETALCQVSTAQC